MGLAALLFLSVQLAHGIPQPPAIPMGYGETRRKNLFERFSHSMDSYRSFLSEEYPSQMRTASAQPLLDFSYNCFIPIFAV